MQNFLNYERIDAKKRNVIQRLKDFGEIYELYTKDEAIPQSDRCVQCGDPYCMNKCPLHNFIPQWLKSVSEKDFELAFKISNETSPFPEILGRVCPQDRLCEGDCTLNDGYGAISIGAIETFISESGFKKDLKIEFPPLNSGRKVAIIGSGPASLSCATFLLRAGVEVEMFERDDRAGGLLTYGIPGFKLDKSVVERRVALLQKAGLKLHLNREIQKDDFNILLNSYDALFIGIGATKGNKANIANEDSEGVYLAMEFLKAIQKKEFNKQPELAIDVKGKDVIVIGGGDTAMDCVRTALREGADSVKCLYRRDAYNMPGSRKEYKNAIEEGAEFIFNVAPKAIIKNEQNRAIAIEIQKTTLGAKDSKGKQKLEIVKDSETQISADIIILALGFSNITPEFLAENGIECNKYGAIVVNSNYETSKLGVYAGGDCYRGADLVVTAVYDGRESAKAIIKKLLG